MARVVIGVDEVGRGALAGPVVVCGAAFDFIPDKPEIQDSKTLTACRREGAAEWVRTQCLAWSLVEIWPEIIDRFNILEATRLAMLTAARALATDDSMVVVDHMDLAGIPSPILSEKAADSKFFCVAAASIVAKVHRDRIMVELGQKYPDWGWDGNKGYCTRGHRVALQNRGRTFLHRTTFGWSPVLP